MYFLADEERRFVHGRLAPDARRQGVAEDLRGWNWGRPPLSPIFDTRLAVYEIASQYCASGRDLYLRRVQGERPRPSAAMVEGGYLHGIVSRVLLAAKRIVYRDGADCLEALEAELAAPQLGEAELSALTQEEREDLVWKAGALWRFEHRRILHRVQEAINRHPHIGPDAIVALALPVVVDHRLDGAFLGLSSHLATDAFATLDGIVMDVKFGPKEAFHRLSTTAYALVLESTYERPVDIGGLVYVSFRGRRVVVEREFHLIDTNCGSGSSRSATSERAWWKGRSTLVCPSIVPRRAHSWTCATRAEPQRGARRPGFANLVAGGPAEPGGGGRAGSKRAVSDRARRAGGSATPRRPAAEGGVAKGGAERPWEVVKWGREEGREGVRKACGRRWRWSEGLRQLGLQTIDPNKGY